MAWNTSRTKDLLFRAAVEEFSEHGPLGARTDRIAERAGVNKERLYAYFGRKEDVFEAVLEQEMTAMAAAVPLEAQDAADLGLFAARVYDFHRLHPHYLRLLQWETLSRPFPPDQPGGDDDSGSDARAAHYADGVHAVAAAQRSGKLRADVSASALLYTARALAVWWLAAPVPAALTFAADTAAADSGRTYDDEARRTALITLVRSATSAF